MDFPSGERFVPKDDELLLYLFNFVSGDTFPAKDSIFIPIPTVDLYGHDEPWVVFDRYSALLPAKKKKKKDMYFFTRLKKNDNRTRVFRTVGGGKWHGTDSAKEIFYRGKGCFGYKKSFVYRNSENPTPGLTWLLKEYSLSPNTLAEMSKNDVIVPELEDYVLCRIRIKKEKKKGKVKGNESVVSDDFSTVSDLIKIFKGKIAENAIAEEPSPSVVRSIGEEKNRAGEESVEETPMPYVVGSIVEEDVWTSSDVDPLFLSLSDLPSFNIEEILTQKFY